MEALVFRLEKLEIISENSIKYWDKDRVYCQLNIINLDIIIKTQDLKYTYWELNEYVMHIIQLLDLGVIRMSTSRHRSLSFIVNKSSEKKYEQSRMIFNYKRLNNNCHKKGYKILDNDQLINKIQNSHWFSKFDMKSSF